MHATEFLRNPPAIGPVVVAHGADRYLRQEVVKAVVRQALGGSGSSSGSRDGTGDDSEDSGDDAAGPTRFDGRQVELSAVLDELRTVSMWGGRRVVLVEETKEFITEHRAALERYVEKPARRSVLLLDVESFPKNTRLFKAVALHGLELDCSPLSVGDAVRWVTDEAKSRYGKRMPRDAAQLMLELVGSHLGLLTQELAKTAAYVGERPSIDADDVGTMVGGWRLETTWAMLDALQAGQLPTALGHLDKLLTAGEAPLMLFGGITFSYRKLAQAVELARLGQPLRDALAAAGVFGNKVGMSEQYLRRVGRAEAEKIHGRLIEADSSLKGGSRLPERIVLERLLIRFGGNP